MGVCELLDRPESSPPTVWRTKLRSTLFEGHGHTEQVDYCLRKGLIGIGWGIDELPAGSSFDQVADFIETCGWDGWTKRGADTVRRFGRDVRKGDFVWTRHTTGKYLLCRVTGDYRYDISPASKKVDVHQVRKVKWAPTALNDLDVPGGVVRSFIGTGSSFSRIHDPATRTLTPYLWAKLNGGQLPELELTAEDVLQRVLDPYDVEDLIYMWMQVERGYIALPRTQQKNTPAYEWTMVHRKGGNKGIVQVKTGNDKVDLAALHEARSDDTTETFAFATSGLGRDDDAALVDEFIEPKVLLRFASKHRALLPERLSMWFDLAG